MWPWFDRRGRISPLKLCAFIALFGPALWIVTNFADGSIGPRPLNEAIREFGLWTIRLVFLTLAITPFAGILRWPRLLDLRRMFGVAAFAYACSHLSLYVADQSFDPARVASEIILRTYLTIGFVALLGLTALAATSTDAMVRWMGARKWRRLHRLAYVVAVLGVIHFCWQSKLDVREPTVMAGLLVWLFGYRVLKRSLSGRDALSVAAIGGLGLVAALLTALGEAVYFWLTTGVAPGRVLAVDLTLATGVRPAIVVLAVTGAVFAATALREIHLRRAGPREGAERRAAKGVGIG